MVDVNDGTGVFVGLGVLLGTGNGVGVALQVGSFTGDVIKPVQLGSPWFPDQISTQADSPPYNFKRMGSRSF